MDWYGAAYRYDVSGPQYPLGEVGIGALWVDPRVEQADMQSMRITAYATIIMRESDSANGRFESHLVRFIVDLSILPDKALFVESINRAPVAYISTPSTVPPSNLSSWTSNFADVAVDLTPAIDDIQNNSPIGLAAALEMGQVTGYRSEDDTLELIVTMARISTTSNIPAKYSGNLFDIGLKYSLLRITIASNDGGPPTAQWCRGDINRTNSTKPESDGMPMFLPQSASPQAQEQVENCNPAVEGTPPNNNSQNVDLTRFVPDFGTVRFFWARATPSGTFYVAGTGSRGIEPGSGRSIGIWKSCRKGGELRWQAIGNNGDWGASLAGSALVKFDPIPFEEFRRMYNDFRQRAISAGRASINAGLSPTESSVATERLVALFRNPRTTPTFLWAVGWRESVELSVSALPVAKPIVRLDARILETPDSDSSPKAKVGTSAQTSELKFGIAGEVRDPITLEPSIFYSFDDESRGGGGKYSTYLRSHGGELDSEGRRWTVIGVPIPVAWLDAELAVASDTEDWALQVIANIGIGAIRGAVEFDVRVVPWWNIDDLFSSNPVGDGASQLLPPWKWPASACLNSTLPNASAVVTSPEAKEDFPGLNANVWFQSSKTAPLTVVHVEGDTTRARLTFDFGVQRAKENINTETWIAKTGNLQHLAAYGRFRRHRTWEFRRAATMCADSFAVTSTSGRDGIVRDLIAFGDDASEVIYSDDSGTSYVPIGSRLVAGQEVPDDLAASLDSPRWQTEGLGNMLTSSIFEGPPLSKLGKPKMGLPRPVIVLTDDGGVFRSEMSADGMLGPWADITWNLPPYDTRPTPEGLGPPALAPTPPGSYYDVAHRLAADGRVEIFLSLVSTDNRIGHVVLSRDGGRTWTNRLLNGLPSGEVVSLVTTLDPHDDLFGTPAPSGAVYASMLGYGVFVLAAGSYEWQPTGPFVAVDPAFADASSTKDLIGATLDSYSPPTSGSLPIAGSNVSLPTINSLALKFGVVGDLWSVDDTENSLPDFELGKGAIGQLVRQRRFGWQEAGLDGVTPEVREAALRTADALEAISAVAMLPFHLAVTMDGKSKQRFVFASLNPIGSITWYSQAAYPGILELGDTIPPAVAQYGVSENTWKQICGLSLMWSGLYQLWDADAQLPHAAYKAPPSTPEWRPIAGMALARAALAAASPPSGDGASFLAESLSMAQVAQLNYPQAWRSITSLSASRDGRLAATTEAVRLPLAKNFFSPQTIASDDLLNYSPRSVSTDPVFVDGGVFEILVPQSGFGSLFPVARLLLTHPHPAACAWISKEGIQRVVAGFNFYGRFETGVTQATVQVVAPFTSLVPPTIVGIPSDTSVAPVSAGPGVFRADERYFGEPQGSLLERWPCGLFILSEFGAFESRIDAVKAATVADASAALVAASLKLLPPSWFPDACIGTPTDLGTQKDSTVALVSIADNLCCGPQRYVRLRVGRQYLYALTRGGSAKRWFIE